MPGEMGFILVMVFRLRTIIQPFSLAAGIRCKDFVLVWPKNSARKSPVLELAPNEGRSCRLGLKADFLLIAPVLDGKNTRSVGCPVLLVFLSAADALSLSAGLDAGLFCRLSVA